VSPAYSVAAGRPPGAGCPLSPRRALRGAADRPFCAVGPEESPGPPTRRA